MSTLDNHCPACGSEAGVPCVTVIDGEDTGWTHDARILLPVVRDLVEGGED